MELRILKKIIPCLLICILLLDRMLGMDVLAAEEEYPLIYEELSDNEFPVVALTTDWEDYTVLPGDSLWKIAERLWGDGHGYVELAETNKDLVKDPDLIFPGMVLSVSKTASIIRKEARYGGVQMGTYSMDMPYGWTAGIIEMGNAFANFALLGDKAAIACLIQDKKKETVESVGDWEQCMKLMADYVKKNYDERVSDLAFEHYRMVDQDGATGELYLYTYMWQLSEDYPDFKQQVCVGLKLTDHVQAEFLGYGINYDIHSTLRYVCATFEEHFDPESEEKFTVNDSNMQMIPETEWELDGMFNSFAWVDEFFTSIWREAMGIEEEKSSKEKLIEKMQN